MQIFLATSETTSSTDSQLIEQTANQLNAFQRFWESIDWDAIVATLIGKTIYIFFLIFLFILLKKVGKYVINKTYDQYSRKAMLNESRLNTLHSLLNTIFQYILVFFFLYSLLAILGVPIGSLLAGAGIAGVAIGLGAQGFMNDMITGFFIIMEQQMDVGDYVRLVNLSIEGTVVSVGIRTVQIKATDGTIHFIPNRNITTISNLSRSNMQVLIDVRIKPEEGFDKIQAVIERVNHSLAAAYPEDIQVGPDIFGLVDLGNNNFAIRTTFYVLNGQQYKLREEFLSASVQALTEAGFTIPDTPITLK
ncbi:MAG: mechanosensitive ion channel family protein [Enterococcus sp.]